MLQEQLLRELDDPKTDHQRRCAIGDILSQVGDPRPGVGLREDGIPDIVWLPVTPGGTLKIQDQTYNVPPFFIAKYPITYIQYEAFVQAKDGFDNQEWWQDIPEKYQKRELAEQFTKFSSSPRDTISWYQSIAFTRWLNYKLRGLQLFSFDEAPFTIGYNAEVRLPLEWEWQWAAQNGNEQRQYPWGEWQEGYANTEEARLDRTIAVGMYPQGAAACGALDMSGNVWEWCLTKGSNENLVSILKGGAFSDGFDWATVSYRSRNHPDPVFDDNGFRVVVSTPVILTDL